MKVTCCYFFIKNKYHPFPLCVIRARPKVCESDLLAVRTTGAYGAVICSNYNARPRPAEIMVDSDGFHLVRKREILEALYRDECVLPE